MSVFYSARLFNLTIIASYLPLHRTFLKILQTKIDNIYDMNCVMGELKFVFKLLD